MAPRADEPSPGSDAPEPERAPEPVAEPRPPTPEAGAPLAIVSRALGLSALIAAGIVLWAIYSFGKAWVSPFLLANDLGMGPRMQLIRVTLISAGVGLAIGATLLVVAWRKRWSLGAVERVLWFLSPAIVLALLPQIFRAKPWVNRQDVLAALVLSVALLTEVLVVKSLAATPERVTRFIGSIKAKAPDFLRRHGPLVAVLCMTAFYVAFMSFYNLRWHYKIKTHNFDLAIDNNLIYSALKGAHMQSTVSFGAKADQYLAAHAKLGQYVILPVYAVYPRPETLIVIQSALLGLGALPLFGFARRFVSSWAAAAIALAYLAYHPLHCANFVESKYLSLSGFFVLATFWAVETKRWIPFVMAFIAATLMREDVPIGLAMGGTFLLLTGHRPKIGLVMAIVSSIWFVVLRFVIMDRAGSWWFPEMYKGLWSPGQQGFGSVVKTLLTNPLFVLNEVLEKEKLLFVLQLLAPLVLLPLRRWYLWIAIVPGTVLTLLATDYKPLHGYSFQYVMHWVPYLFLATPVALKAITDEQGLNRARAAIVAMAVSTSALSYNYGAFARRPESVKGGYFAIEFTFNDAERQRYAELLDVIRDIPSEASVVATENVGPHVSSRRYMYALRRGVYDAEYMLAARTELDFEQTRKLFTDAVKSGSYGVLKRQGDFVLLKKGHDASGNTVLAQDWKL